MGTWRTRAVAGAMAAMMCAGAAACTTPPPNSGGGGLGTGDGEPTEPAGDDTVRLNELQFIGTHNSYKSAPDAPILNWLTFGAAVAPQISDALGDPRQLNYDHAPLPL